jgi:aprataxin
MYQKGPQMAELDHKRYEAMLKEDLACWRCNASMKNMPTLKSHLQEEWDKEAKREKAKIENRRKLEEKRSKETTQEDND